MAQEADTYSGTGGAQNVKLTGKTEEPGTLVANKNVTMLDITKAGTLTPTKNVTQINFARAPFKQTVPTVPGASVGKPSLVATPKSTPLEIYSVSKNKGPDAKVNTEAIKEKMGGKKLPTEEEAIAASEKEYYDVKPKKLTQEEKNAQKAGMDVVYKEHIFESPEVISNRWLETQISRYPETYSRKSPEEIEMEKKIQELNIIASRAKGKDSEAYRNAVILMEDLKAQKKFLGNKVAQEGRDEAKAEKAGKKGSMKEGENVAYAKINPELQELLDNLKRSPKIPKLLEDDIDEETWASLNEEGRRQLMLSAYSARTRKDISQKKTDRESKRGEESTAKLLLRSQLQGERAKEGILLRAMVKGGGVGGSGQPSGYIPQDRLPQVMTGARAEHLMRMTGIGAGGVFGPQRVSLGAQLSRSPAMLPKPYIEPVDYQNPQQLKERTLLKRQQMGFEPRRTQPGMPPGRIGSPPARVVPVVSVGTVNDDRLRAMMGGRRQTQQIPTVKRDVMAGFGDLRSNQNRISFVTGDEAVRVMQARAYAAEVRKNPPQPKRPVMSDERIRGMYNRQSAVPQGRLMSPMPRMGGSNLMSNFGDLARNRNPNMQRTLGVALANPNAPRQEIPRETRRAISDEGFRRSLGIKPMPMQGFKASRSTVGDEKLRLLLGSRRSMPMMQGRVTNVIESSTRKELSIGKENRYRIMLAFPKVIVPRDKQVLRKK